MRVGNTERAVAEAASFARAFLLARGGLRFASERIILGRSQADSDDPGVNEYAFPDCITSRRGVNGGEVVARVFVPRDESNHDCRVEWTDGTA